MTRKEFKKIVVKDFPEVMTIIPNGEYLDIRISAMQTHFIKVPTKTPWTAKNLNAVLAELTRRKQNENS